MLTIVDGRRYDTEKSTLIANYRWGAVNDFKHYDEDLYKTKRGNYFLSGFGGPASPYRRPQDGGGWTDGYKVIPLSPEEAFEWAQKHMRAEDVEREFGEQISDA